MPDSFKTCEVQVWWSNVWNSATEKAVDKPYTIEKCEVEYLMGGDNDPLWGDANYDGEVDMSDVVLIMQSLANPNKFGLDGTDPHHLIGKGAYLADVDKSSEGITSNDALRIQEYLLNKVETLDPTAK